MPAAPSPAPSPTAPAASARPMAARCSSTRSATWTWPCRPSCCACCRTARWCRWAARRWRWTCASWRPPTATCAPWCARGSFREDLFYRIGVVPVHLAPLRERLSDILPLAEHFLALAGGAQRLSAEAAARLLAHPWPGNVRELRNAMERAAVLAPLPVLSAADFAFLAGETRRQRTRRLAGRRPARRGGAAGDGDDPPRAGGLRWQPRPDCGAAGDSAAVVYRKACPVWPRGVPEWDTKRLRRGR